MTPLRRVLRLWDLVLLNVVGVVGLRWWLTSAGAYGYAALPLWGLACLLFFVPASLAVVDLTTRYPEEGGIYAWTRRAFGEGHGFVSGWCLWTNNMFYFPTVLLFAVGNLVFILGPDRRHLEGSAPFMAAVSLALFWLCFWINLRGLHYGRWLHNIGAVGTWIPAAILIGLGAWAVFRFGPATPFGEDGVVPRFDRGTLAFFSLMCFGFSGIEIGSLMGEEIVDPRRSVPRAILLAGGIITTIYMLGTVALLFALPQESIGLLSGVSSAIAAVGERAGLGSIAGIAALLMAVGALGTVSAWLGGASRIPFAVGLDRHLPEGFGRLHPRHATPHIALLVTALLSTVPLLLSVSGGSVRDAYLFLAEFTLLVYFVPYLYLFAALFRLSARGEAPGPGVVPVPGGRAGAAAAALVGLATTGLAIGLTLQPAAGVERPWLFHLRLAASCLLVAAAGWAVWRAGRRRRRPAA
jgi:amino acid transporter